MNSKDDVLDELARAYPVTAEHLTQLHDQLAIAAQADGMLDVAYRTLDTPVGPLLLAATQRGLVRVAFGNEDRDTVLQELSDRLSPRILNSPSRLNETARQLDEYFAGRRQNFDLALDWQLSKGFRNIVLHHLPEIAFGRTASYADVAQLAGKPKAVRAVGTACATNPLPVIVPCHRVVRSDGTMGQYRGGPEAKRLLLTLESAS